MSVKSDAEDFRCVGGCDVRVVDVDVELFFVFVSVGSEQSGRSFGGVEV